MSNNQDRGLKASLGGQNTFVCQAKLKIESRDTKSLGDQVTFGGAGVVGDFDDEGMEVVDLAVRYKIEKTLGKGGMGEVLLATDTRLGRKVAIKRTLGDAASGQNAVNRFLTEAKSIAALNHPNVVQIYDYGRAQDGPFLIMEYVDGGNLLDRCRDGAMPLEQALDLACQLCDGLGRAHVAGIVHRDIKPANILITADGIPKLTDFGLAKDESAETGMTMAGAVLGTLDFMPPEQRRLNTRELDGLLPLVQSAAALRGDREDLQKLLVQLEQRKEKRAAARNASLPPLVTASPTSLATVALDDYVGVAPRPLKRPFWHRSKDMVAAIRRIAVLVLIPVLLVAYLLMFFGDGGLFEPAST